MRTKSTELQGPEARRTQGRGKAPVPRPEGPPYLAFIHFALIADMLISVDAP